MDSNLLHIFLLAISPNNRYKSRNHYLLFLIFYFPPNSLFVGQTDPTRLPNDRYKFIHGRDGVLGRDGRDSVIGPQGLSGFPGLTGQKGEQGKQRRYRYSRATWSTGTERKYWC